MNHYSSKLKKLIDDAEMKAMTLYILSSASLDAIDIADNTQAVDRAMTLLKLIRREASDLHEAIQSAGLAYLDERQAII